MNKEKRFPGKKLWRWLVLAAFILASFYFGRRVFQPATTTLTHGFGAYYSASRLLAKGKITADIYDPAYFQSIVQQDSGGQVNDIYNANPPTTSLMFLPLSSLTIEQARLIWTWVNVGFLIVGLGVLLAAFGHSLRDRSHWPVWLGVLTFGLLFRPVIENIVFGQAYLLTFFLLCMTTAVFFRSQSTKGQTLGGLALALSLLLKTAGWPLLILLLWLKKGRYLASVIGTSVLIILATLPIFPLEMWLGYGRLLGEVSRSTLICVPAYQTTRSWLCHLFAPDVFWQEAGLAGISIPWQVPVCYFMLGAVCLLLILRLARKRPNTAFMALICWSVLFLPLGETHHHTVILIPFVWFLVNWTERSRWSRALGLLAAACYLISFPVNAPQFQTGWQALLAYPYLAGCWLIFLAVLMDSKAEIFPDLGIGFLKRQG